MKPLRTMIDTKISDDSGSIGRERALKVLKSATKIAGWLASLQRSQSRSASRRGSSRNQLQLHEPEGEGQNDIPSLALLDSDVVMADKFKVDQVGEADL